MTTFFWHVLAYLILSFTLGATWHVVLFKEYYKKLAIYSNIENPRFVFGFSSMLFQGIVFAFVYPLIHNPLMFATGLCMLLISFTVFAEVGKQNTTSLSGFVTIQIIFSIIQTILVTLAFWLI